VCVCVCVCVCVYIGRDAGERAEMEASRVAGLCEQVLIVCVSVCVCVCVSVSVCACVSDMGS